MQLEAKKLLFDIKQAVELVAAFTVGKQFEEYMADAMLRAAVERKLEVIGEAVGKLAKLDSEVAARISEYRRMITFRNILIHGYADVDDRLYGKSSRPSCRPCSKRSNQCFKEAENRSRGRARIPLSIGQFVIMEVL